jgi:2'-5' RNA ligase
MTAMEDMQVHEPGSGGGTTLRLFTALHVPNAQADQLYDVADAMSATFETGRALAPSTMHLTWAFLGDVREEYVPVIAQALDAAAMDVPGPTLCTASTYDSFGRGRVLGAEVQVELLAMLDAARDRFLDAAAPYAPRLDHRAWRPHVSLLRAPRDTVLPEAMFAKSALPAPVQWVASDLRLYASLPSPVGTQHRLLHAVPLGVPVEAR